MIKLVDVSLDFYFFFLFKSGLLETQWELGFV